MSRSRPQSPSSSSLTEAKISSLTPTVSPPFTLYKVLRHEVRESSSWQSVSVKIFIARTRCARLAKESLLDGTFSEFNTCIDFMLFVRLPSTKVSHLIVQIRSGPWYLLRMLWSAMIISNKARRLCCSIVSTTQSALIEMATGNILQTNYQTRNG